MKKWIIVTAGLIAITATAAGLALAASGGSKPPAAHPVAATSRATPGACQIALAANSHAGTLITGMTTANAAASLARAASIWTRASTRIQDSGVPLLHTQAGQIMTDLSLAGLQAARAAADIRLGMIKDLGKTSTALMGTEAKIGGECP